MKQNKQKTPSKASQPQALKETSPIQISNVVYWICFGVLATLVLYYRSHLLNVPFERDEGEYAYFGQLILDGIMPYKESYNMKLPGIYYMYAFIMMIFGKSFFGVHLGALLINAGSMLGLYLSIGRLYSKEAGIVTAAFYGIMSLGFGLLGFAAHATQFATFFMVWGLYFFAMWDAKSELKYSYLSGLFIGLSFTMKQQAIYFILAFGLLFLIFDVLKYGFKSLNILKNTALYSAGVFTPYLMICALMMMGGVFDKFWFWTVEYAGKYASGLSWATGKELLDMTFTMIWNEFKVIFYLAILGIIGLWFTKFTLKQKVFGTLFLVFSFLATTPGFYFRQHYFIVFLPSIALLAGVFIDALGNFLNKVTNISVLKLLLSTFLGIGIILSIASKGKNYYMTKNPKELCKSIYTVNPFVESIEIAKYIKEHSTPEDRIAVLGSEPQIPFYADRKSATGHIYTYGLMEDQPFNLQMQEEMISEIEKAKPKFMVYANVAMSWLPKPNSPKRIFDWYGQYSKEHYNLVGLVDLPDNGVAQYYWDQNAQKKPVNQNFIYILQRK